MKSFIAAVIVSTGLAVAAAGVLDRVQEPVASAYTTGGVRLDSGR